MSEFVASFNKQVSTNQLRTLRNALSAPAVLTMPDPCTVHVTPGNGVKQGVIKNDLTKAAHKLGLDIKYHRMTSGECRTRVSQAPMKASKPETLVGHEKADRALDGFKHSLAFTLATHRKRVGVLKTDLDDIGVKYGRGAAYALADDGQAVSPVTLLNDALRQVTGERDKLLHNAEEWWAEELTVAQLNRLRTAVDNAVADAKQALADLYADLQRVQRTAHRDWLLRCLGEDVKRYSPLDVAFAEVYEYLQKQVLDEVDTNCDEARVLEMTADRVEQLWPVVQRAVVAAQAVRS